MALVLPYSTTVVWGARWGDGVVEQLRNKAAEMTAAGKTDGNTVVENPNGPELPPQINTRNWIDFASAQEWKDFVLQFNPASCDITGPVL